MPTQALRRYSCQDSGDLVELSARERSRRGRIFDDCATQGALTNGREQLLATCLAHVKVRRCRGQLLCNSSSARNGHRGRQAQPDARVVIGRVCEPLQFISIPQQDAGLGEQKLSALAERDTLRVALEKRGSNGLLQAFDPLGHRGLRQAQPLCRASDAAFLRNRHEILPVLAVTKGSGHVSKGTGLTLQKPSGHNAAATSAGGSLSCTRCCVRQENILSRIDVGHIWYWYIQATECDVQHSLAPPWPHLLGKCPGGILGGGIEKAVPKLEDSA